MCIMAFNVLLFVMGVVVLALSIAMSVMFQRDGWTAVISAQAIGLSVFAGVLMVLTSIGGCYSAKRKNRNVLCVNLFCITILFIVLMIAGSMLIRYAVVAQNQVDLQSVDLTAEDDKFMNNALISVYSKCCSGCNSVDVALYTNSLTPTCNMMSFVEAGDDFEQENNGWTAVRCNATMQTQKFPGHPVVLCENPGPCLASPQNVDNCWIYPENADRAKEKFPPQYIDKGFCNTLTTLTVNGRLVYSSFEHTLTFPQTIGWFSARWRLWQRHGARVCEFNEGVLCPSVILCRYCVYRICCFAHCCLACWRAYSNHYSQQT